MRDRAKDIERQGGIEGWGRKQATGKGKIERARPQLRKMSCKPVKLWKGHEEYQCFTVPLTPGSNKTIQQIDNKITAGRFQAAEINPAKGGTPVISRQ